MMPETILFDLDGTLLDTLADLADSTAFALQKNGYPPKSYGETRRLVGNGVANLIARSLPADAPASARETVLADFRAFYAQNCMRKTTPYEGILPLLERLKRAGCRIGVLSNKTESVVQALCAHFFGDLVDVSLGDTAGRPRKPAPDAVFEALSRLQADARGAIYIGDSEVDLQTAKNAGIPCISVSWGFRDAALLLEAGAPFTVESPAALAALLSDGTSF